MLGAQNFYHFGVLEYVEMVEILPIANAGKWQVIGRTGSKNRSPFAIFRYNPGLY